MPVADVRGNPAHLAILEEWLRSYRPNELFDADGAFRAELASLAPKGDRRMSANPHANGGRLLRDLRLPDFRDFAVEVERPGATSSEATRALGKFLRDVIRLNPRTFRLFGPDETSSNRLEAVFDVTDKAWSAETLPTDEHLAPNGRVLEILSEHTCQGWLEGYLLTGRHGLFNCYEAFIHIVDSMFNQHAKWLKTTRGIPWRRPIASLNYLLSSHVWRQDHNGFSHQDPGFIDHVVNKKAEVIRVYLPPDANTLLSVADHCLRSRGYVYRVVHGGNRYRAAARVDEAMLEAVVELDALAPLHNRRAAAVMRAAMQLLPGLPHVACFDTAFHAGLPEEAWRYPLPIEWVERWGIRRYGFHGLSVTWAVRRAAELLEHRADDLGLIVAHLGSGCSVSAVDAGRSVDTSMGFTPYEGLMMGTRAGSVDPGILLRLAEDGVRVDELADGLSHRSGLAAMAGTSDVRAIERRADDGDTRAGLALEMFARRAAASVGAAATALPRFDALVFTGGIGEHSAAVRAAIVRRLGGLRVPLALAEVDNDSIIAAGPPAVIVVTAREDRVIADQVAAVLR